MNSFSTTETQAHRENKRLSPYCQSTLAISSTLEFSLSFQTIAYSVLAYDGGTLCTNLCHTVLRNLKLSGSWDNWWLFKSLLYISSSTANSLRYCLFFSIVVHFLGKHIRSFLKGYFYFMADRSRLHMMKACAAFLFSLSMPLSVEGDLSYLALLPIKSWLLIPLSKCWSNQVTIRLPEEWWLKSFHICCSLLLGIGQLKVLILFLSVLIMALLQPYLVLPSCLVGVTILPKWFVFCNHVFFCLAYRGDWDWQKWVLWLNCRACCWNWSSHRFCCRGLNKWRTCCLVIKSRTLFPFRVLNSFEQGSVVMIKSLKHCIYLCWLMHSSKWNCLPTNTPPAVQGLTPHQTTSHSSQETATRA